MKSFLNNLLLILLFVSCSSGQKEAEQRDVTLIVPGKSAEGFVLNETVKPVDNTVEIKTSSIPDSFSFNNQIPPFSFSKIIYLRNRYAVFVDNDIVKAIAGLSSADRVTDDAVKLTDGADNFIMNYGNNGLRIVKDGNHRIYIYRQMGIVIFDDNSDDSIDLYLILTPEK